MTIHSPACPLCGAVIHDDGRVLVDMDAGLIVVGHAVAQLTRLEFAVFAALWRAKPRVLGKDALLAVSADAGRDDEREIKLVDVVVHKIRKKLAPLGIVIGTAWGEGYRIERGARVAVPA